MTIAIKIENLSKQYRLGLVSTRTLSHDLNRWYQMNIRGKEDPYLKIGEVNDRAVKGDSDYIWALRNINLEVEQGEVLGIIGKNGAGKSTLLKILSKVTTPTTGTIKAKGRIASLLEVGTGFHPEMTGRENIYMNGAIMGMTKAEITRKLDEIIDFAGVERYIDTPVKRYSSGMTVRLGFAVAAHLDPEILVVDEVLAVGDAEFQKKAIGKMQSISKGEGRTVLFVSHNLISIEVLCKSAMLLKNGKLDLLGKSSDIVNIYLMENNHNYDHKSLSISERNDREGIGNYKIVSIEIKTDNIIATNEKFIVKIGYVQVRESNPLIEFGISIWTEREIRLISISSLLKNELKQINENGMAICIIDNLPLVPGNYMLNVFISSINGIEDYVIGALKFKVAEKDIYGTGKNVNPEWGAIAIEHNWDII